MKKYLLLFTLLFLLPSCVKLAATNSVITEKATRTHRTIEQVRKDSVLEKELKKKLKDELKIFAKINNIKRIGSFELIVNEGRVFVIGNVAQDEINNFIYNKIWENKKVLEVINELKVDLDGMEKNSFKDFSIKQAIKFKLLTTSNIKSQNYTVIVKNATAYIIGIAEDEVEIQKIGYLASTVSGVENVIIHIIEKNDSRRILE